MKSLFGLCMILAGLASATLSAHAEDIHIRLLPGDHLKVGQAMRIQVRSARPGWLHVYDLRGDGEVNRLFPGRCTSGRKIRAGKELTIPSRLSGCEFVADAPGRGKIVVVVSARKMALKKLAQTLPPAEQEAAAADDEEWRTIEILPAGPQPRRQAQSAPADLRSALSRLAAAGGGEAWIAAAAPYEISR